MPFIRISYEYIRNEAKEFLKELKNTNPNAKLTQSQTLIANKYNCKNLGLLRSKCEKNHGYLELELTHDILAASIDFIRKIYQVEPYNDNGISCATISIIGRYDSSAKTVRLFEKNIENILDNKNTILSLHEHFSNAIGEEYVNLVCELLNIKYSSRTFNDEDNLLELLEKMIRKNRSKGIIVNLGNHSVYGINTLIEKYEEYILDFVNNKPNLLFLNIHGKHGTGKLFLYEKLEERKDNNSLHFINFDREIILNDFEFNMENYINDLIYKEHPNNAKAIVFYGDNVFKNYNEQIFYLLAKLRVAKIKVIFFSQQQIFKEINSNIELMELK